MMDLMANDPELFGELLTVWEIDGAEAAGARKLDTKAKTGGREKWAAQQAQSSNRNLAGAHALIAKETGSK